MKLFVTLALSYTTFIASQTLLLATPAFLFSTRSFTTVAQTAPPSWPQPESGNPGGRVRGGAKRSLCELQSCPSVNPQLTALVPFTEKAESVTNVWGLTTEANPTFWFYVPYTKDAANKDCASTTEFVLQKDEDSSPTYKEYKEAIALPAQPGVISISLPANAPSLEIGKQYRWFLTINCNSDQPSNPTYVEGVIKRVNLKPEIAQQLKRATPLQQFTIYAQNGIWYNALSTLAKLRQQYPQDAVLKAEWKNLLSSIRLDDVAEEPILFEKP
ncbi:DUF928 domain-containing protein [Nostoc sp. CENA67]|uniref:DUF928 domain-containing protein n=1 Tax=Amazonocrinis nigriterrae CENA67 TaxID=2794033 RepID=A0A8J7HXX5_9NOST|nr:DUF928 domain-containing protein [Amazonocrinis nigriterrae]MBH8565580.1 DUF928 domain-containing protein [Amazonocrinis nigriterrae CENA67]